MNITIDVLPGGKVKIATENERLPRLKPKRIYTAVRKKSLMTKTAPKKVTTDSKCPCGCGGKR